MRKFLILVTLVVLLFSLTSVVYADAFDNANLLLEKTRGFLVTASTAFAIIGVACGAIMKKLSMGNEQKIQMGNKLISGSIIAWAVVNGLPLIFATIQPYIS